MAITAELRVPEEVKGGDFEAFTDPNSFAAIVEGRRFDESGGDFGFDTRPDYDTADFSGGFMEVFAGRGVDNSFDNDPAAPQRGQPDILEAPAAAAGAIAAAAREQKVQGNIDFGQRFDVSEKANTRQFFRGQQTAQNRNEVKLDQTTTSVEVLAGAHQKLAGAEQALRENMVQNPTGQPQSNTQNAMNEADPVNKSASGGVVKSMLLGSAATAVANVLAPGAAPFVRAAATLSTASAAGQSAAMMFGGNGSQSYDRPRSKAEAREMRDPSSYAASSSPSTNYFDQGTAGAMIMAPSEFNKDFNSAVANRNGPDHKFDPRMAQISELQIAQGEIWKEGLVQTAQMRDAEIADTKHNDYRERPQLGFGELLRAADANEVHNGDQFKATVARVESTDRIVDAMKRGQLDVEFVPNMTFSNASGPKLG